MKIPCYGRQNGEKRNFFCLYLQRAIIRITGLIEINKIRIQPVIYIVNTEHPTAVEFFIYFMGRRIDGGEIKPVIRRKSVLIDPAEILR